MPVGLDEVWRRRQASTRFRSICTFEGDALVLGAGTKMLDLARMLGAPSASAWTRLTALLKAAGYEAPGTTTRLHVQTALLEWWRGEHALAQLRLALLPLPTLRRVEDAYPLFLAEYLLDRGMTPDELLRELDAPEPDIAKFDRSEPRLPRGVSGGGEWTRGTGSPAERAVGRPTAGRSVAVSSAERGGSSRSLIHPVFLDTEQEQTEVQVVPFLPHKPTMNGDAEPHQHQPVLGPPPFVPALNPFPSLAPQLVPLPSPVPPKGGGAGDDDRPDPPTCRAKDDVPHGSSANAMMYEYFMAQLLNPEDPTYKRRPSDPPNPKSQAYYLYVPSKGKYYSFDDCNKTDNPFLFIPDIKRGDGVENKNNNYWIPTAPRSKSYQKFIGQMARLDEGARAEGLGRKIFYCFGSKRSKDAVQRYEGDRFESIRYAFCPFPGFPQ